MSEQIPELMDKEVSLPKNEEAASLKKISSEEIKLKGYIKDDIKDYGSFNEDFFKTMESSIKDFGMSLIEELIIDKDIDFEEKKSSIDSINGCLNDGAKNGITKERNFEELKHLNYLTEKWVEEGGEPYPSAFYLRKALLLGGLASASQIEDLDHVVEMISDLRNLEKNNNKKDDLAEIVSKIKPFFKENPKKFETEMNIELSEG